MEQHASPLEALPVPALRLIVAACDAPARYALAYVSRTLLDVVSSETLHLTGRTRTPPTSPNAKTMPPPPTKPRRAQRKRARDEVLFRLNDASRKWQASALGIPTTATLRFLKGISSSPRSEVRYGPLQELMNGATKVPVALSRAFAVCTPEESCMWQTNVRLRATQWLETHVERTGTSCTMREVEHQTETAPFVTPLAAISTLFAQRCVACDALFVPRPDDAVRRLYDTIWLIHWDTFTREWRCVSVASCLGLGFGCSIACTVTSGELEFLNGVYSGFYLQMHSKGTFPPRLTRALTLSGAAECARWLLFKSNESIHAYANEVVSCACEDAAAKVFMYDTTLTERGALLSLL